MENNNKNSQKTIDNYILKDEKILWRTIPNKKAYILSQLIINSPFYLFFLALSVVIGLIATDKMGKVNDDTDAYILLWIFFAILFIFFVVKLVCLIVELVKIKHTEYAYTNKRVIIKFGFKKIEFLDIDISKIDNVHLHIRFTDKIFKVGDIYINHDGELITLDEIKDPYEAYEKLQLLIIEKNKVKYEIEKVERKKKRIERKLLKEKNENEKNEEKKK